MSFWDLLGKIISVISDDVSEKKQKIANYEANYQNLSKEEMMEASRKIKDPYARKAMVNVAQKKGWIKDKGEKL